VIGLAKDASIADLLVSTAAVPISSTKSISLGGAPAARNRLDCCALLDTRGRPSGPSGSPQASANAGQAHNQSWTS
jgi:hypothetical protein